jgi:hypothetical protein
MSKNRRDMDDWERETMILGIQSMREPSPIEYAAPGPEQKWRARDLVDIHWKLVNEDPPSESYNRIMSCIIGHANPSTGRCQLKQRLIAAETGYWRDTVIRAIKWWSSEGFLKTQSMGRGRATAYHPQWESFELYYLAVAEDIEAQKEAWRRDGAAPCSIKGQHAGSTKGQHGESHHGATHESQIGTSKGESHPEWTHPPSADDVDIISEGKRKSFREERLRAHQLTPKPPEGPTYDQACNMVSGYCEPFHWTHLTEEDFDAAVAAELRESGAGRAVVRELAFQRAKEAGAGDE